MFKIKDLTDQLWDSGVSGGHKETEHTNESVLTDFFKFCLKTTQATSSC